MDEKEKEKLQQLYNKLRSTGELNRPEVRPLIQKAIERGLIVDSKLGKPTPRPETIPGDPTLTRPLARGNTPGKRQSYPSPLTPQPDIDVTEGLPGAAPLQRSDIAKNKSAFGFFDNLRSDYIPTMLNMAKGVGAIAAGVPMAIGMGAINAKNAAGYAAEARRAVERGDYAEAERLVRMAEDAKEESDAQGAVLGDMAKGFLGGDTGMIAKMKTRDMFERQSKDTTLPPALRAKYKAEAVRLSKEIPQGVADAFYENPVQSSLNAIGIVSPFLRAGMGAEIAANTAKANRASAAAKAARTAGNVAEATNLEATAARLNEAAINAKKALAGYSRIDDSVQSLGIPGVLKVADKVASRVPGYNKAKTRVATAATLPLTIPGNSNLAQKLGGQVFSSRVASEFMGMADPAYRSQQYNKAITDVLADRAQQAAFGVKFKRGQGQPPTAPPVDAQPIAPDGTIGAGEAPAAPPSAPDTPLPPERLIGRSVDLPGIELPTDLPQVDVTLERLDEQGNPVETRTESQSNANRIGAEPLDVAALRRVEEAPQARAEPIPEAPAPLVEAPAERSPLTPEAQKALGDYRESLRSADTEALLPLVERHAQDPAREPLLGAVVDELGRRGFTDEEIAAYRPRPVTPETPIAPVEAPLTPEPAGATLAAVPETPHVDLTAPLAEAIAPPKLEPLAPRPVGKPDAKTPIATAINEQGRRVTALPEGLDEATAQTLAARILHENADNKALIPATIEALGLDRQGRAAVAERVQDIVAAASEVRIAQNRRPNPTAKDLRAWVERNRPEAIQKPQAEAPTNQPDGTVEQASPETPDKPSLADRFGTGAGAAAMIPLNLDSPILAVAGVAGAAILYAAAKHAPGVAKKLYEAINKPIATRSAPARRWDELMSNYIEARLPGETGSLPGEGRTQEATDLIRQQILKTVESEFELKDKKAAQSVAQQFTEIGDSIVRVMDTLGEELVNAGLIDPKAFEENRGFYLRRIYEYWENPEGYLEKAEAELRAGGADDARIQAALGAKKRYFEDIKGRPIGDAEKVGTAPSGRRAKKAFSEREELTAEQLDMLREIAPASIRIRRGGEITGRELSKAELVGAVREKFAIAPERANEIREAAAAGADPGTLNLSGPMEEAVFYYPDQFTRTEAKDGLVGLGRWIPQEGSAPVWEGMEIPMTVHKSLTEAEWKPTTIGQKLLYIWKGGVTAWNPSAYLGNIFGNTLLSYLGGGLAAFNPVTMARAMDSIKNRDEMFQVAMTHSDHPFESMRLEISTRKNLDPDIQYPENLKNWIRKEGGSIKDWTTDMYGGIDTVFKHALFIQTMDTLEKIDPRMTQEQRASQAGMLVAQSFPNFRHGTPIKPLRPAVKAARRGAAPFIAWDASAIPIVAHAFMEHPHRIAMFPLLYKGYQDATDKLAQKRRDKEKLDEEKRILPDYIKQTSIRIPASSTLDSEGELASAPYLNVNAFNPLSGVTGMEGPDGWLQTLISRTNPMFSMLAQLYANERTGTEIPITNRSAPGQEQAMDTAKFAAENLVPGYRFVQGARSVATGKSPYPLRREGEEGDTYTYDMTKSERIQKASQMARLGVKQVDLARAGRDARLGLMETRKELRAAISKALREAEAKKGKPLTDAEQDAISERYIKLFEAARPAKMGDE